MAAESLPTPGTKHGPCANACAHRDCAATRQLAATKCIYCRRPIGFDKPFYDIADEGMGVKVYAHADEHEDHVRTKAAS